MVKVENITRILKGELEKARLNFSRCVAQWYVQFGKI